MKKILITGSGGFIGSHLANRLAAEGNEVWGVDLKEPLLKPNYEKFYKQDLRIPLYPLVGGVWWDEVYQLAANMGGAGFCFTGENDYNILTNSVQANLAALNISAGFSGRIFFSSSACVYKENPDDPRTPEASAYPAMPDSDYGWEKLFSERLYQAYARNYSQKVRIARYHNIFGPWGTWEGGREKAPAAICRKVAECADGGCIELWGDGSQVRSFLYVDECVEGTIRLMRSEFEGPVNIGSEEMVTLKELAEMVIKISGKTIDIKYVPGPTGVHGRNSCNSLIREKLKWEPSSALVDGLQKTYAWVAEQVERKKHQ